jgi:hypothetical protein
LSLGKRFAVDVSLRRSHPNSLAKLTAKHYHAAMIKRTIIVIWIGCYPRAILAAEFADTYMFGIGLKSCAYWQSSPATVDEGRSWIVGHWSGLNTFNNQNHTVGSKTDGEGIIGEVKRVCDSRPSISLSNAVLSVYTAMAGAK